MGYTQCHSHSFWIRGDSIYLQEYLTGPIKSGLGEFLNTIMQPEAWLVVVSWDMEGQERLSTITQLGLTLR